MTKALVTIEVDLDTSGIVELRSSGLGESSNPNHPKQNHIKQGKRDFIWDITCEWLKDKEGFVQIKEVRLPKEVEL